MATQISEKRSLFWPILFALLGGLNLIDYFYKLSLQPDDLLQGLGFSFMVPLAYLYPSPFTFKPNSAPVRPAAWARWLSFVGAALAIMGLVVEWL